MSARFSCHHGHLLEIPEAAAFENRRDVVCPVCGSIASVGPSADTDHSLDPTLHSPNADKIGDSDANASFSFDGDVAPTETSIFQTDPSSMSDAPGLDAAVSIGSTVSRDDSILDTAEFEPPSLSCYHVLEEIGRGGMGVVYRARDDGQGREVALKTLQRMSPDGLHRFKQEFRTLADIAHPNLASLYELLSDGTTWCFSMELLEGVDLLEYVWSGLADTSNDAAPLATEDAQSLRLTPQRLARLKNAFRQLAVGLNALHESGVLHKDIKPSNVLMTREGRLVLLDFGLATEIRSGDEGKRYVQGTPIYMAPEQAVGLTLSAASDWYAVGVIMYELLTGRFPFSGRSMQVLRKKQTETPLDPGQLAPGTPAELSELCVRLLSRDPQQRPSAGDVLRVLGEDALANSIVAHEQRVAGRVSELVGRERHLSKLQNAFLEVEAGNARSVFVHGESGMGKSVLLRSFLDSIKQSQRAVVLEGRCYEQESVPFKALDSLIDSLAVYLQTLSDNRIQSVMPRDRLALTRVFPVVGGIPEVSNATYPSIENADQQELRQRAMNALRELLQRLAIREPLVLYVDDLQWGDVDSVELLADLVRPPDAPRMLLLASYRTEDIERSTCLRALTEAYQCGRNRPHREDLAVHALTDAESQRLALTLLGSDDEANRSLAELIAKESGGWPFFVWELAQHVQDDAGYSQRSEQQTLELDEVIWSRVGRLPAETKRMLELVAVAGRPTSTREVYQTLKELSKGPSLLAQLRTSNLVRTTESSENVETLVEPYHDRIRESVVAHLDHQVVKDHNLQLALTIEAVSGISGDDAHLQIDRTPAFEEPTSSYGASHPQWERVFDLASFFDAAGDHRQALPYALLAAEQSREQNALEVAEQQFRIALKGAANAHPKLRFRIEEGLGDVLVVRGRYEEAKEHFQVARSLAEGDLLLARLDWKLGIAAFKKGDVGDARNYSETAIRALGERPPSRWTALPRALKEAAVQAIHTKFPKKLVGRSDPESTQGKLDLFRARVYDQLTFSYWFCAGMNFVLWAHLRQMNLAERYPPSPELGRTYSFHAVTMTGVPMAKRGIAYAQRAHQIAVDAGDLWGQGRARAYYTFACIVLGQFHEGIKAGDEAVTLLEQAGDVWESNMARMIATVPRYHLGDLKGAYQQSKKAYEIAVECQDYSGVCIALLFWAPSSPHTLPPGAIETELKRDREDPVTIAGAVYARGLELLLSEDKPREAAEMLHQCLLSAKKYGVRNVCIFSAATWKATALRIVAQRETGPSAKRLAVREAKQAVRFALKITKSYVACRPHALREAGRIAAIEGREAYAARCFEQSLDSAANYNAEYDTAKTELAFGEAGMQFGWSDAEAKLAKARTKIACMEDVEVR